MEHNHAQVAGTLAIRTVLSRTSNLKAQIVINCHIPQHITHGNTFQSVIFDIWKAP